MGGSSVQLEKKNGKHIFIHYLITFLGEHSNVNNDINALLCICSCFYVQVFVVNYFWDFPEFFWIEGWVGGVYRIQTFLNLYIFVIFQGPLGLYVSICDIIISKPCLPTSATPRSRDSTSDVRVLIPRTCLQIIDAEHFAELDKTKWHTSSNATPKCSVLQGRSWQNTYLLMLVYWLGAWTIDERSPLDPALRHGDTFLPCRLTPSSPLPTPCLAKVFLDRPLFRFHWGVHVKACLMMLDRSFPAPFSSFYFHFYWQLICLGTQSVVAEFVWPFHIDDSTEASAYERLYI